jgi:hypothetical protein
MTHIASLSGTHLAPRVVEDMQRMFAPDFVFKGHIPNRVRMFRTIAVQDHGSQRWLRSTTPKRAASAVHGFLCCVDRWPSRKAKQESTLIHRDVGLLFQEQNDLALPPGQC